MTRHCSSDVILCTLLDTVAVLPLGGRLREGGIFLQLALVVFFFKEKVSYTLSKYTMELLACKMHGTLSLPMGGAETFLFLLAPLPTLSNTQPSPSSPLDAHRVPHGSVSKGHEDDGNLVMNTFRLVKH